MIRRAVLLCAAMTVAVCLYGQSNDNFAVKDRLPVFYRDVICSLSFPLSWEKWSSEYPEGEFEEWRKEAREKLYGCMMARPPYAGPDMEIIASEKRDGYTAYLIMHNLSSYSRVMSYLLVPEKSSQNDKFPAVIMLHDHGAEFDIGKEKLVRPIDYGSDNYDSVLKSATEWTNRNYDSTFVADYYAANGFIVFVTDALFWGDRATFGKDLNLSKKDVYDIQQALAANMEQMGMNWSAMITYDDIASAEFVSGLPDVDTSALFAVGFSMGGYRAWMLSALSNKITGGACVCWMSTVESLMTPGNNQTRGGSSFSMTLPNIRNYMDYPDVATIACPKPMLFFNGSMDKLFPTDGVNAAYAKLRKVWDSQDASKKLLLKTWPLPHFFSRQMQDEIVEWMRNN